ncbi:MAG: tRNA uridine(34) 5-carboxymethylaminomethyl modification radical SAM/GNAT enzyme Elp3 [Dehalococcoidales bacterium]|nr:tRNA uridine(34) 5-carboxymethylaminomethyl modification radical SAM/GNAT enzyme Elp3 [Dehalococcoidales bacterium]
MKKIARTISGVTPVAVMTSPLNCPGECIYCPTFAGTPQSYTPTSPAVLRGVKSDFDAAEQVKLRIKMLTDMGHPTDKIELIIMGGTFLAYPIDYQYRFIKDCYDALNGVESADLEEARHINETAVHRCTGLCIETRPDYCGEEEVKRMLDFGATRVELGVQVLEDEIYRLVKRGHTVQDVITATRLLKEYAFKVHYHWMPGLPGSDPEIDYGMTERMFADTVFRPDGLKIYPTMVIEGTVLEQWYREGKYTPYPNEVMIELIADIKELVPGYVRISRVLRDIPANYIVGGLRDSLRTNVQKIMRDRGNECRCIRCREYGHRTRNGWEPGEPKLSRDDYAASGGLEIFLSYIDENDTLFGLLRLRIQRDDRGPGKNLGKDMAMIRELHVYGPEVPLSQQDPSSAQHRGLGRRLLAAAEKIASEEYDVSEMMILSGVGAREYYRNYGYELEGPYMVKKL